MLKLVGYKATGNIIIIHP